MVKKLLLVGLCLIVVMGTIIGIAVHENMGFSKFVINGKRFDINNVTLAEIERAGFTRTVEWQTNQIISAKGYVFEDESGKKLYVGVNGNKVVSVGIINSDHVLKKAVALDVFGDLQFGMTEQQIRAIDDFKIRQSVDFVDMPYVTHDGNNSIVMRINSDGLEEFHLVISKEVGVNLTAQEKLQCENEKYQQTRSEYDATQWWNHSIIKNCDQDLSKVIIDDEEYDFNTMTVNDLIDLGYRPLYQEINLYSFTQKDEYRDQMAMAFCKSDGYYNRRESFHVVYNDKLQIEAMILDYSMSIAGIADSMKIEELENILDVSIANLPTTQAGGCDYAAIKNDKTTVVFVLKEEKIGSVIVINNELVASSTQSGTK
jgi:hypothetical protein